MDNDVVEGDEGELQVLLDHPMSGYLHDAAATAAMFDGRWLRTGDLVRRDAEGRIGIVGRSGDFIKTLGTEKDPAAGNRGGPGTVSRRGRGGRVRLG